MPGNLTIIGGTVNSLLISLASTLIGPLSGLVTLALMDYVDDVKKWTANLPDYVKQAIVMGLATVIPIINAKYGLGLSTDPTDLLSQPSVQSIVATALAFILKGHQSTASKT